MSTIDLSTAEIETIYVAYEQVLGLASAAEKMQEVMGG